ncbi:MAG: sulfotransferase [Acidimicrobiales bacterium]
MATALHRLPPGVHRLLPPEQREDLRHRLGRFYPWEAGYDFSPPPLGAGERPGPPDFVGVGAMMAGWRWWYRLIAGHPAVWSRPDIPVARHYLSHFCTARFGADEVQRYHAWFPRRQGTVTGEWSASYSAEPWVAPLLARAAPDARLVLLVRDPVERLRLGLAVTTDNRGSQVGAHTADAVDRGYYGYQLKRLLEFFPPEQVLTLQLEQCRADPMGEAARTYRFLGLDDSHRPLSRQPPSTATAGWAGHEDPDTDRRLTELYVEDVVELLSLVPELDVTLWPHFAHLADGSPEPGRG